MSNFQKRNIQLPPLMVQRLLDAPVALRDDLIKGLRRVGWTYASIADPLGLSRERVRQISSQRGSGTYQESIPLPPYKPVKVERVFVEPSAETLARLKELQPKAQQVRSTSPRYRQEAEEYTALLNKAHVEEGVSVYRLAKRLGITHSSIRFRLARYGYKPSPTGSDSPVYRPLKHRIIS
jgi:predicted transcriptional regulator